LREGTWRRAGRGRKKKEEEKKERMKKKENQRNEKLKFSRGKSR